MENQEDQRTEGEGSEGAGRENPGLIEEDPTLLSRTEVRKGSFLGNERIRVVLPSQRAFKRVSTGLLEATERSQAPRGGMARVIYNVKRLLIGAPLASAQAETERLTKFKALAVLSSDAISSVAYATEAILITLVAAGSGNLGLTLPISFAIVALLAIVAISYRQTIPAYPNGGGSYIVAKDNLGTLPGLVAAASLMIDYVLTVAVSVSAGVLALVTLSPALQPYIFPINFGLVIFITLVNLRGVRESGSIFAIPTYIFIGSALLLIIVGSIKSFFLQHDPIIGNFPLAKANEALTIFLVLKSFAAGCSAMTGIEAISNGVPAFKRPEARNARITLTWMAVILGTLFLGMTLLATSYGIRANPASNPTVIGQIALRVFTGPLYFMYPVFQLATLAILTLAANTSYADFPRLASLLARDGFLPHQFAFRGDRLAFSTGIVFLALLAILLLIVFNGLGALTTLLVSLVIASTKFLEGAWIVVLLIPLLVLMFLSINHHYSRVERERITDIPVHPKDIHHRLIVPIAGLDSAAIQSLAYARSITKHVTAVHVAIDMDDANKVREAWERWQKQ